MFSLESIVFIMGSTARNFFSQRNAYLEISKYKMPRSNSEMSLSTFSGSSNEAWMKRSIWFPLLALLQLGIHIIEIVDVESLLIVLLIFLYIFSKRLTKLTRAKVDQWSFVPDI